MKRSLLSFLLVQTILLAIACGHPAETEDKGMNGNRVNTEPSSFAPLRDTLRTDTAAPPAHDTTGTWRKH